MLRQIVNRLRGQVCVRVETAFPERVLNLCAAHQIPFWDLRWENPLRFTFTMTGAAWRRLRREAQRLDARLEVERREGLPYFLRRKASRSPMGRQDLHTAVAIPGMGVEHTTGHLHQLAHMSDQKGSPEPQLTADIQGIPDKIGDLHGSIGVNAHSLANKI